MANDHISFAEWSRMIILSIFARHRGTCLLGQLPGVARPFWVLRSQLVFSYVTSIINSWPMMSRQIRAECARLKKVRYFV
jgi:hypothetical protein